MKYFIAISVYLLCVSSKLYAQYSPFEEDDRRIFYGGFALGMNFSTVNGDTYDGFHKVGLNTGAQVHVKILPYFTASLEMLYTQKGSRGVRAESGYTGTLFDKYYLDLNYVEMPLTVHYFFQKKWNAGFGISYSRLIHSKEDAVTTQPVNLDPTLYPFRKEDYNYIMDGGLQLNKRLFLNARYQFSINTIRDENKIPQGYGYANYGEYNELFTIRLVYLIN